LLEGRKVAGILLESSSEAAAADLPWLAIGIGVNLATAPAGTSFPATSLAGHCEAPSPAEAMSALAAAWDRRFRVWRTRGFAPIREAWLEHAAGLGQAVVVRLPGETVNGRFQGLDVGGALLLALPDGSSRAVAAGEVFFPAS
jgi:BirA family biotin operon repressor/biotin-[acetyl-CoA-carboxylase] ligase